MFEKLPESLGEILRPQRAGLAHIIFHQLANPFDLAPIKVSSSAFRADGPIPVKYTADGAGVSPPLEWTPVPEDAASIVIVVEDADSPTPQPLVHAIVVSLEPQHTGIPEGALDSPDHPGIGLHAGRNSFLMHAWLPPDPPPGHGSHRYVFQVFALRTGGEFSATPGRHELMEAISERALGGGYLIGIYERERRVPVETLPSGELEGLPVAGAATAT